MRRCCPFSMRARTPARPTACACPFQVRRRARAMPGDDMRCAPGEGRLPSRVRASQAKRRGRWRPTSGTLAMQTLAAGMDITKGTLRHPGHSPSHVLREDDSKTIRWRFRALADPPQVTVNARPLVARLAPTRTSSWGNCLFRWQLHYDVDGDVAFYSWDMAGRHGC